MSWFYCFLGRRLAAEKRADKVAQTVSHLKEALTSKEAEPHQHLGELVRLRQTGEAHEQAEAVEGRRLRALADQLVCECGFHPLALLLLLFSVGDTPLLVTAAVGLKPIEVAASGSGVLQGAVDAIAGVVAAAGGVCA